MAHRSTLSHNSLPSPLHGAPPLKRLTFQMLWNWHTIDACFLARSWHVRSMGGFALSCIAAMLLVVCLEALRRLDREYDEYIVRMFRAQSRLDRANRGKEPEEAESCASSVVLDGGLNGELHGMLTRSAVVRRFRASLAQQFVKAVLHAVTFGVAYIVMLLAMYFNGYIIISIIVGAGLGKFICDWTAKTVVFDDEPAREGPICGHSSKVEGIEESGVCA
ncbi:Ctr copper transporter family-domain-containing protein [Lasiosphaeris hirsuta]|uniref:Copper transport protein n=1 Tax=Lasiosphaeris hirsuta TaxID=260670 RepID=A0AA40BA33_9PEZI|nr:Ctr copper transporter family-domain-containing protein [Lasiosphaeris hirsuta]